MGFMKQATKQATVMIPDDLDDALAAYERESGGSLDLNALAGVALREFLAVRGFMTPFIPFNITPIEPHGGPSDVSERHDCYFAEGELGSRR